jgi:glycosyltransferase involved in cell wall biosynthesis
MLAQQLAEAGHEVRVYSLIGRKREMLALRGPGEESIAPRLVEFVQRARGTWLRAMWAYRRGDPPFWANRRLERPTARLEEDKRWAEVVILDFPFVLSAGDGVSCPVVLNTHNVEARLFGDATPAGQRLRDDVRAIEERSVRRADLICCSSEEEIAHFRLLAPGKQFVHVPNAVDPGRFVGLSSERARLRAEWGAGEKTRVLLFPASAYGPNREGYEFLRAFTESRQEFLEARDMIFVVTGSVAKKPERFGRLVVTGIVPSIEGYFAAADWGLNPIFSGSGTSVKLAEMIAAGLPVVTTRVGARGFALEDGNDAVVFEHDDLEEKLGRLPAGDDALERLRAGARLKAAAFLDTRVAVSPLEREISRWVDSTRRS